MFRDPWLFWPKTQGEQVLPFIPLIPCVARLVTVSLVFSVTPAYGEDHGLSDYVMYHPNHTFWNEKAAINNEARTT